MKVPANNKWIQTNRGDILGNLWSSFGINLQDNLGALRVSPRLKTNTSGLNNVPVAFARFGQRDYALAGTTIYRNTNSSGLPNDAFIADDSTSASTDYSSDVSDMIGAWNVLLSTSPTKLRSLNATSGGTWLDRATITTGLNHKMCYFKKYDRIYFSDQTIKSMTEDFTVSATGDYTLNGSNASGIVDLKPSKSWIWIAVKTEGTRDNSGAIWKWDGISNQIAEEYKIRGARSIVALVASDEDDAPYAMSDKGILYKLSGGGFAEVGRLPYTNQLPYLGADPTGTQNNDRFIHPNGLILTKNDTVLANINGKNGDNTGTQNENLASGLWEWSSSYGFTHRSPFTYDPISSSITDYGQNKISRAGAIANMNVPSTASGRDGTILAGATLFTDSSSTTSGIYFDNSNDTVQKYGYIVTTKIFSSNLVDTWNAFKARFRKFLDSDDFIKVKYRTTEDIPVEVTVTWTATNTFTTSSSSLDSRVGQEIEVLQGKGSGKCAHIVSVTNNAGTRTVVLDETFTGATSGTAIVRVQSWTKLHKHTGQTVDHINVATKITSTWIQFKICMQFKGEDELYDIIIDSSPSF
jgi:hypothetical protein